MSGVNSHRLESPTYCDTDVCTAPLIVNAQPVPSKPLHPRHERREHKTHHRDHHMHHAAPAHAVATKTAGGIALKWIIVAVAAVVVLGGAGVGLVTFWDSSSVIALILSAVFTSMLFSQIRSATITGTFGVLKLAGTGSVFDARQVVMNARLQF